MAGFLRSGHIWHDHSTILNNGLIMITVHVIYDKVVFLTNEEYHHKTGKRANVQYQMEQPETYMLVLGSSSVEDQAAIIPAETLYVCIATPLDCNFPIIEGVVRLQTK